MTLKLTYVVKVNILSNLQNFLIGDHCLLKSVLKFINKKSFNNMIVKYPYGIVRWVEISSKK